MNENIENDSKKKNIIIIILILVIIAMGGYILYDKNTISLKSKEVKENSKKVQTPIKEEKQEQEEIKPLDLNKCINNSNVTYTDSHLATNTDTTSGISMNINPDKTSVTLSINWNTFGPISMSSSWAPETRTYQINGFSGQIKDVYVGITGQDAMGITLFYLMEDGTVEYTPMFNFKTDSQGNSYYEMNYKTENSFTSSGKINTVTDVIKIYTVSATNGTGWSTTIGAKKDGSFYDLGSLIK